MDSHPGDSSPSTEAQLWVAPEVMTLSSGNHGQTIVDTRDIESVKSQHVTSAVERSYHHSTKASSTSHDFASTPPPA